MISPRRDFLRQMTGAALGSASWNALAARAAAAEAPQHGVQAGEAYWQQLRRQFPLEEGLTYLNAANICPASQPVLDRQFE